MKEGESISSLSIMPTLLKGDIVLVFSKLALMANVIYVPMFSLLSIDIVPPKVSVSY